LTLIQVSTQKKIGSDDKGDGKKRGGWVRTGWKRRQGSKPKRERHKLGQRMEYTWSAKKGRAASAPVGLRSMKEVNRR